MWQGKVEHIFIAPEEGAAMQGVPEVRAFAGQGLQGDRYFKPEPAPDDGVSNDVTLIEMESIEAVVRDYDYGLAAAQTRRNLVTRGVPLNHLVGKTFTIGGVVLRGAELCEPCSYLAGLTDHKVLKGLVHRGGLRARIVQSGTIKAGDTVTEE